MGLNNLLLEPKTKILCFLPVIGDTKDAKRVEVIKKGGLETELIAFERESFKSRIPQNQSIIKLSKIEDGRYLHRAGKMISSFFKLRRHIKNADIIYCMSPDLGIFAFAAALGLKKSIVIDVADIRKIQIADTFVSKILRSIEKFVVSRTKLLVVTSYAFITDYYEGRLNARINDYLVLENKVDYLPLLHKNNIPENNKIRIGYFGYIRDDWTIELLKSLALRDDDRFSILIAGVDNLSENKLEDLKDLKNFDYYGPFKSPDDLLDLYSQIDCMAIFYPEPTSDSSWFAAKKICRSNRFYESCFFKKPILTFSFNEDGKEVDKYQIGYTLDSYNLQKNVEILNQKLTKKKLSEWVANLKELDPKVYTLQNEHEILKNKLNNLLIK